MMWRSSQLMITMVLTGKHDAGVREVAMQKYKKCQVRAGVLNMGSAGSRLPWHEGRIKVVVAALSSGSVSRDALSAWLRVRVGRATAAPQPVRRGRVAGACRAVVRASSNQQAPNTLCNYPRSSRSFTVHRSASVTCGGGRRRYSGQLRWTDREDIYRLSAIHDPFMDEVADVIF